MNSRDGMYLLTQGTRGALLLTSEVCNYVALLSGTKRREVVGGQLLTR